jgi:hypothetical protein
MNDERKGFVLALRFRFMQSRPCGKERCKEGVTPIRVGRRIFARIGGTQSVTFARGTVSDTVEVEVKGDFYRSDCIGFSGG